MGVTEEQVAVQMRRLLVMVLLGVGLFVLSLTQIWLLVAMVVAVRQALDYHSTFRAVGVCLVGWVLATVIGVVLLLFVAP